MKKRFLILPTAVALVVGAFAFAGTESDKTSSATDLDRLQKKISALESRVKSLEQRLQAAAPFNYVPHVEPQIPARPESGPGLLPPTGVFHPFALPPEVKGQGPKIWGEGEINGWKYYLIPCGNGSGASPEADPLKVILPK